MKHSSFVFVTLCVLTLTPQNGVAGELRLQTVGADYAVPVLSWTEIPFRTVVRQQYDFSCGSAAVATLLRHHYDRAIDEAEVFRAMYATGDHALIRRQGFSLLDMQRYLRSIGYNAEGFRLTGEQLKTLDRPAIALIKQRNYRHFVVIKGVRDGHVLVGDPASGMKTFTLAQFAAMWDGVVFMIRDVDRAGAFNLRAEWAPWSPTPYHAQDDGVSAAAFTRELPPVYQITPVATHGGER